MNPPARTLADHLDDYLTLRRALGCKLIRAERYLRQFLDYLGDRQQGTLTVEAAADWVRRSRHGAVAPGLGMEAVRGFAVFLHAHDPAHEVPPPGLFPRRRLRAVPYLYSPADIATLQAAAGRLRGPLRAETYTTLIALLAVTGLRIGEALALDDGDIDTGEGMLIVRQDKAQSFRLVPLHPTALAAVAGYRRRRDQAFPGRAATAVLASRTGDRLTYNAVHKTFTRLAAAAGLGPRTGRCRPTIHGLRHSFAVSMLAGWYRDGADVPARLPWLSTVMGHSGPASTYWYVSSSPELMALAAQRLQDHVDRAGGAFPGGAVMTLLAPSLQAFFTDRLMRQLQASGHTIRSYRATWRLLLLFAAAQRSKAPSELDFADLSAPLITGFLDHLEHQRGNTVRTRNLRLAAIHSMFAYAAPQHPEHADDIARVLAVPGKRFRTSIVTHLSEEEITALLQAPDPGTWTGRRDHALLLAAVTTGLRAGELAGLTRADTHLGDGPHLECHGKGRKDRVTPLLRDTVAVLAAWLGENPGGPGSPLFPTRRGTPMSQDAIEDCVKRHAATAAATCPSLTSKNVTPHVLRHSCAVRMLRSGIDIAVIALWMGHESTRTTMIYLKADLELKQRALDRTVPVDGEPGRYRPPDDIIDFLDRL